ncbi:MAG TPA: CBS domain-containing protein [Phaeodactylibacter sp.]|nr:CBS domain-containing protein [Phaeodactylibacter sp.]
MNPNITIEKIMTESTLSVKAKDSLKTIDDIFNKFPFHHIPVVNDELEVIGIISKTDVHTFLKKLTEESSGKYYAQVTIENTKAEDIMTPDPYVIDPDDTIGLAADIFLANTIHALPVVEMGKLTGIITTHDLLQYAYKGVLNGKD